MTPDLNTDELYAVLNVNAQLLVRATDRELILASKQIVSGEAIKKHIDRMAQFAEAIVWDQDPAARGGLTFDKSSDLMAELHKS